MSATVIQGDVRTVMSCLPSDHFDCCVTSPPYFGLRDYGVDGQIGLEPTVQEYLDTLVDVCRDVRRVLKPQGTFWLNIGDSYAANRSYQVPSTKGGPKHSESQSAGGKGSSVPKGLKPKDLIGIPWLLAFALRADGWYLRQDIIWHKPNPMPESVRDRCTKAHEYIFLLSKSERYYFDSEAMKEPAVCAPSGRNRVLQEENRKELRTDIESRHRAAISGGQSLQANPDGNRNRRSVWTVATKPYKGAHFATFPPALIEPCIKAGCPEGGIVLDPFGGSGTTGAVANSLGRRAILIEINPAYIALAEERIAATDSLFTRAAE